MDGKINKQSLTGRIGKQSLSGVIKSNSLSGTIKENNMSGVLSKQSLSGHITVADGKLPAYTGETIFTSNTEDRQIVYTENKSVYDNIVILPNEQLQEYSHGGITISVI